jgi:hypothetical protein
LKKLCHIAADAGQEKLRLGLGEPHAGRSAQNGGSRTATLDTSSGGELSASSGSPMWDVDIRSDNHIHYNKYLSSLEYQSVREAERS